MNAERLLTHYDTVADAPDAIARLRCLILDLAVRGKLVPQDASDEPASKSLKLIAKERAERIGRGEMRRGKPVDGPINSPFEAPPGWVWVRLRETGNIFSGNSVNEPTREQLARVQEGRPFIATKDVGYGLDRVEYENGLLVEFSDERFKIARTNSVLICAEGGSAGKKMGLADREICFGNKLLANETWSVVAPKFVLYTYMSKFFYEQFSSKVTGVIGGISIANFLELPFCLPPLPEQHRIVAKVDELMGLCDRLEAARAGREAVRDRLVTASLARLNAPETETFPADARFALDALPALTTRPDQVKTLRQTILNLAVRGKLVAQDAKDEPGPELLKRIAREKMQLLESRRIKSDRPLPGVQKEDAPFELPQNWVWARAQNLSLKISDGVHKKPNYVASGVPFVTVRNLTETDRISFRETKFITEEDHAEFIRRTHPEKGDVLITKDGTIGVARIVETERAFSIFVSVALVKMVIPQIAPFLTVCINSDVIRDTIVPKGAALKHLHLVDLRNLPLPLPPLAEQHRIVAKVDALMALCDRLEASLTATGATRRRLLDALIAEALAPVEDRELAAAE